MAAGTSRVEDLRYTTYTGVRRGRLACLWAFARQGALHALGAGRGWRGKLIPVGLVCLAFAPALIVLGIRALFASSLPQSFGRPEALTELVPYEAYYSTVSILILALAGIITPELLCPDRRDRVLDLYYSTAVSPREYLTAKFGSALGVLLLTTLAPVLFLFAGNILFAVHPLGYFQDHWTDLPRIVAAGFVIASYYAALGLAVSSLTSRRAFAMGGAIALLVASGTISAILAGLGADEKALLLALPVIPIIVSQRMFPDAPGVQQISSSAWLAAYLVVVGVSLAVLLLRYRRSDG
jgi:ABC-2 type transport system permease protein